MSKIFVLIGSSSELSNSFKEILLSKNEKFISISRAKDANITVKDYFLESEEIVKKLKAYKNLNIIFFNGYLAENRPFQIPNHNDVVKTDYINFTVPYSLTEKFISNDLDIEKFIYISSIAAIKPRYKNLIYGLSKFKLEKTVPTLTNKYLIFRFGKIDTKMSKTHPKVPFTLSKGTAAKIIYRKINKKHILYPSFTLNIIAKLIYLLPSALINLTEKTISSNR